MSFVVMRYKDLAGNELAHPSITKLSATTCQFGSVQQYHALKTMPSEFSMGLGSRASRSAFPLCTLDASHQAIADALATSTSDELRLQFFVSDINGLCDDHSVLKLDSIMVELDFPRQASEHDQEQHQPQIQSVFVWLSDMRLCASVERYVCTRVHSRCRLWHIAWSSTLTVGVVQSRGIH
jgi:hypothetical protein